MTCRRRPRGASLPRVVDKDAIWALPLERPALRSDQRKHRHTTDIADAANVGNPWLLRTAPLFLGNDGVTSEGGESDHERIGTAPTRARLRQLGVICKYRPCFEHHRSGSRHNDVTGPMFDPCKKIVVLGL